MEAAIQSAQDNIFLLGGVGLGIVIPQVSPLISDTSFIEWCTVRQGVTGEKE